ncbi:MAG: chromate transporter [Deltaproteobacteria bacterium]|nr:chromate transporter [Deltaproteobacteria bacterium]
MPTPSLFQLFKSFFALGFVAFGSGMVALVHQLVVEEKKWLSEEDFRDAVTFSELAPGPFTVHVVMYLGYHLRKWPGLLLATLGFSLPSLFFVVLVAITYKDWLFQIPSLRYFMSGVWAAIFASMISTIIRVGKSTFKEPLLVGFAVLSLAAILVFKPSFVLLIFGSGFIYMLGSILLTWKQKRKGACE